MASPICLHSRSWKPRTGNRNPAAHRLRARHRQPGEGGGTLNGGRALLNRFKVDVVDPTIPHDLTLTIAARSGRLVAEEVSIRIRDGGEAVSATGLRRVKVDAYIARIRDRFERQGGSGLFVKASDLPSMRAEDLRRQGHGFGPTDLATVRRIRIVALYRQAYNSPDPLVRAAPTEYAAQLAGVSRSYAARIIRKAREDGHLRAAIPGKAGEQPMNDDGSE